MGTGCGVSTCPQPSLGVLGRPWGAGVHEGGEIDGAFWRPRTCLPSDVLVLFRSLRKTPPADVPVEPEKDSVPEEPVQV